MYYLGSFDDVVHRYSNTGRQSFDEIQQCLFSLCLMSPGRWILNDGFLLHSEAGRNAIMGHNDSLLMDIIHGGLIRLEQRNPDIQAMVRKMIGNGISSYEQFGKYLDTQEGKAALERIQSSKEAVKSFGWGHWDADSAFLLLANHALQELEADGIAAGYHLPILEELKTTLVNFLQIATHRRKWGPPFGARDLYERVALEVATGRTPKGTAENSAAVLAILKSDSTYRWARLRMLMRVANEIYHTAHALCHATKEVRRKRQVQPGFGALTYCSPLFHGLHANHKKDVPFGHAEELLRSLRVPSLPLTALREPANRERLLMFAAEDRGSKFALARRNWSESFFKALSSDDDGKRDELFENSVYFEHWAKTLVEHDELERPIRVVKPETTKFVIEESFAFLGKAASGAAAGGAVAAAAAGNPYLALGAISGAGAMVVGTLAGKVAAQYQNIRERRTSRKKSKDTFRADVSRLVTMHDYFRFGLMQLSPKACQPIADGLEKWRPKT